MEHVVLVIHLILAVIMIGLVLIQRSEGGGLGIGGGGGGMGGFASPQSTANVLTRMTGIIAFCFFTTSLILAVMAARGGGADSILDAVDNPAPISAPLSTDGDKDGIKSESAPDAPVKADKTDAPETKEAPKPKTAPSVPIAE